MKDLTDFLAVHASPQTLIIVRPREELTEERYRQLDERFRDMRKSGALPEWVKVIIVEGVDVLVASESEIHGGRLPIDD